jgi:hypothetical protein
MRERHEDELRRWRHHHVRAAYCRFIAAGQCDDRQREEHHDGSGPADGRGDARGKGALTKTRSQDRDLEASPAVNRASERRYADGLQAF